MKVECLVSRVMAHGNYEENKAVKPSEETRASLERLGDEVLRGILARLVNKDKAKIV